jgi:hypothetical protein
MFIQEKGNDSSDIRFMRCGSQQIKLPLENYIGQVVSVVEAICINFGF